MSFRERRVRVAFCATLAALPIVLYAFSTGPPTRKTGAPGDGLCTECHFGGTGSGRVEVAFPGGLTYTPGVAQRLTVTVTDAQASMFGFQLTARLASNPANGQAGSLAAIDNTTKVLCDDGSRPTAQGCPVGATVQFIEHTLAGSRSTFAFDWTPPAAGSGEVRIYVAGNGANGNGAPSGDTIYTANYTLTPAAVPTLPTISSGGVVNGASFAQPPSNGSGITDGSWISIFGTNLSATTRLWGAGDFQGDNLPTQLDGVSVTINARPAAVYFISPAQINVQVPADGALGNVQVQVTTAQGASTPATVAKQAFSPAFFMFDPENRKYVAAVHAPNLDGSVDRVGRPGLIPGVSTRPAKPGEVIEVYGTGWGATDPPVPTGVIFTSAARLANPVTFRIGGITLAPGDVQFAGMTGAGLYQFNLKIPDLPDGDAAILGEIGGVRSQDVAFITVQR